MSQYVESPVSHVDFWVIDDVTKLFAYGPQSPQLYWVEPSVSIAVIG